MLTAKDLSVLELKNIAETQIKKQLQVFKDGIPFVELVDSATVGNGIVQAIRENETYLINLFESYRDHLSLLQFVPASGAASRMFKLLFAFIENVDPDKETLKSYCDKYNAHSLIKFFENLTKFPFYEEVMNELVKDEIELSNLSDAAKLHYFVKKMLLEEGLNYGDYPKGLLPFHAYKDHTASAFEEHLYEAVLYSASNGKARLHFTISETHQSKFNEKLKEVLSAIEEETHITFEISFSFQKGSTDTIAVTPDNELFRTDDGDLVFRPSGHGALIENLNDQDADIVFIKNIDNVVVSHLRDDIATYKKMLAGKLLEVQQKAFNFSKKLDSGNFVPNEIPIVSEFLEKELNVVLPKDFLQKSAKDKIAFLKQALDRPIRVCGMVKNVGDPGGGPFWVKNKYGEVSLQIVESAQIDKENEKQYQLLQTATHFNPVDLVCGLRNYKGEKYDLLEFVDTTQGFITSKTFHGRALKGLELPGLWNGAMAGWNTIFMEVPLDTFNPVKTVIDLLKEAHQPIV
ncbi:DUF4301 family protein [Flavobacteriaceae bacterium M23B6Z8]